MAEPKPDELKDLNRLRDLVRYCFSGNEQRRLACEVNEEWYERGSDGGPRAIKNRIKSHLDRLGSYLFSPGTVRFAPHLPRPLRKDWLGAASVARDEVAADWADSGTDQVMVQLIEWALVYNSTVAKLQRDPLTTYRTGYIDPWDFGVSREDVPQLDEQDTMAHRYVLSMPQVERWVAGRKDATELLRLAEDYKKTAGNTQRPRQTLMVSNISGTFPGSTIQGGFPGESPTSDFSDSAVVEEPVVPFVDVWERASFLRRSLTGRKPERFEDWLVTTLLAETGERIFVQRRNPVLPWTRTAQDVVLPGEHPFVMVTPRPKPKYLWGRSEVAGLRLLQVYMEDHLDQMSRVMRRKLNPSKFFSGVSDFEEAGRAMDTDGGAWGSPDPGTKMETIKVELGQEAFEYDKLLERGFREESGIPENITEPGTAPGGVRSEGHFSMAAGIGAGRVLKMALILEDPMGQIATKGFHIRQRHDAEVYERQDGPPFLMSQIPPGLTFQVSAHSAAPIFAEQTKADGYALGKAGWIRGEDVIEMVNPPNKEELKEHSREIDKAKAERSQELIEIQREKAQRGKGPGRPPRT